MSAKRQQLQPPARRPGRPAARMLSPAELAAVLDVPEARIARACVAGLIPHAKQDTAGWQIPEAAAARLIGGPVQRLYTRRAFAELIGFSYDFVWELCRAGKIETRKVLGQTRIPEAAYFNLPAEAVPVDELRTAPGVA